MCIRKTVHFTCTCIAHSHSWHVHHISALTFCVCVCVLLKDKEGLRGGDRGQGSTVGSPLKRGCDKGGGWGVGGVTKVYLHQLSARLLGWRRSCDPPAIVLELPAGNNQSHCYSRSRPHQFNSWPEDHNYSLQPPREVQSKNLNRERADWKQ